MKATAILLIWCGFLAIPNVSRSQTAKPSGPKRNATESTSQARLDVDGVLAWRTPFEDLLGKPKEVAVERFGPPDRETATKLDYGGNAKTSFRSLSIILLNGKIDTIKVFAHFWDVLPIEQVIERAKKFCFSSGTFSDSTDDYFSATTVDTRNTIQFTLSPTGVGLTALIIYDATLTCDPSAISFK